jgi:hypothetical protein
LVYSRGLGAKGMEQGKKTSQDLKKANGEKESYDESLGTGRKHDSCRAEKQRCLI